MRDPFRNIVGPRISIVSEHHHSRLHPSCRVGSGPDAEKTACVYFRPEHDVKRLKPSAVLRWGDFSILCSCRVVQQTPWSESWRCLGLPGRPGRAGWCIWQVKEFDKTFKDSCPLASWPTGHPAPYYVPNCDEVNVCGTGVTGGMFLRIMQNGEMCYSLASASAVLEQCRR